MLEITAKINVSNIQLCFFHVQLYFHVVHVKMSHHHSIIVS